MRRGVEEATKISFKKHEAGHQDFSALPEGSWDHFELPFERAKEMLDSLLDWRALKPWSYRKIIGYLLRSQDDYGDVFQLNKFASAHADWKPFLCACSRIQREADRRSLYKKKKTFRRNRLPSTRLRTSWAVRSKTSARSRAYCLLKQKESEKKQKLLDAFDFRAQDKDRTKQVVDELDTKIAELNAERYSLNQNRKKITHITRR